MGVRVKWKTIYEKRGIDKMNVIAAVDRNWGIGFQNRLLVRIPADQQWFYQTTKGKVIVVGRKTLETFPNGLPLPSRRNVVLSRDPAFRVKGAQIVHSVEEALEFLTPYPSKEIFIAGGESIYRQFLSYCDVAHITKIDFAYEADAHFPRLDQMPEWEITGDSEEQTYFSLEYSFQRFERKKS